MADELRVDRRKGLLGPLFSSWPVEIDWRRFDLALAECFPSDLGAPALATRLIVGLLYLKHAFNESDESLLARWIEKNAPKAMCSAGVPEK